MVAVNPPGRSAAQVASDLQDWFLDGITAVLDPALKVKLTLGEPYQDLRDHQISFGDVTMTSEANNIGSRRATADGTIVITVSATSGSRDPRFARDTAVQLADLVEGLVHHNPTGEAAVLYLRLAQFELVLTDEADSPRGRRCDIALTFAFTAELQGL